MAAPFAFSPVKLDYMVWIPDESVKGYLRDRRWGEQADPSAAPDWKAALRGGSARLVAVLLAVAWCAFGCIPGVPADGPGEPTERTDGPLRVPPWNVYYLYPTAGDVVSDGFQQLLLTGREPVVVDSVEPLGVTGNLEVLEVLYAGARRKAGSIQISPGFPPSNPMFGPLLPVADAEVPAGGLGLELVIGLRVGDGFAARTGLRVHYHQGGTGFVADLPAGIAFCPRMSRSACKAAYEDWEQSHPVADAKN